MQIHEITLREAEWQPLDPKKIMATARPTRFNYGTPPASPGVGTELPTDPALKAKQDALSAQQAQHQQQSANALNTMKANTVAANKVATAPKTLAPATTNPNPGASALGKWLNNYRNLLLLLLLRVQHSLALKEQLPQLQQE